MRIPNHARGLALAVAVAAFTGCDAVPSSPAGPTSSPAPATPWAALTGVDLTGTWTGTRRVEWDPMDGGGSCTAPVVATLTHSGAVVHGFLEDAHAGDCVRRFDAPEVDGVVDGPFVYFTFRLRPAAARAMAHMEDGELVVNWFNVRWTLHR